MGEIPDEGASTRDVPQVRRLLELVNEWSHTSVLQCLSDNIGIYCVKLQTPRGRLYAIAKEYKYKGRASFPRRVVRRGADKNIPIAVFFNPTRVGNAYVFNPNLVMNEGIENRINDPADSMSVWIDIPLEDGIVFGDYITERSDISDYESANQNSVYKID